MRESVGGAPQFTGFWDPLIGLAVAQVGIANARQHVGQSTDGLVAVGTCLDGDCASAQRIERPLASF